MSAASHNAWTDVADQRLLRMYREGYGPKIIAEALGRSAKAISDRRRKLLEDKMPDELSLAVVGTCFDNAAHDERAGMLDVWMSCPCSR